MKTIITMRADLAEEGLAVPASKAFKNYDTQVDVSYITAEKLEGATYGDDPADPDDHPFCYVELKDGRSLYFMSVDLDFKYDNGGKTIMDDNERKAFVKAYGRNVAKVGDEDVTDFVLRYSEGEDMSELDSGDFASIVDALGVWHEAVKYSIKKYAIKAI